MITHTHKIGSNRGKPRLWLDGPRLVAAGFIGGSSYACRAHGGRIIMQLVRAGEDAPEGWHMRRVTGRPDGKPIIDLAGAIVGDTFPGVALVRVTFTRGTITVEAEGGEHGSSLA